MKLANKTFCAMLVVTCLILAACSGVPGGNNGSGTGTGTTGSFTIGGSISGLTGTGLVLQNNGADSLPVAAAATTFTFKTSVASGGKYAVTVLTQPSSPAQTCTVTSGTGMATGNVASVAVTCTTNAVSATIGGTVSNLAANSAVILQNNGGDSLTVTANGPFTFKTPVTGPTDAYAVTVLSQPASPTQICTVTSGSGTASANITNVAVNCVLSYTIGGTVSGLSGTGLILQNSSDLEQLPISAAAGNQTFTFKNLVPTGTAYTVTIYGQPTAPVQTCNVTPATASGTATANVNNVAVVCPAVTYSIGGTVVGLAGVLPNNGPLTNNSFALEDVLGNTLTISRNGPFTFATPFTLNDQYDISIFTLPTTQGQYCTRWNYKGVVTADITDILIDCAHNDWTWINGTKTAGTIAVPQYGSFPSTVPTTVPNPYTNTPGARHSGAGWTDKAGNMWLFGGFGWELAGNTQPDTLDTPMNDLWVCQPAYDYCQWQLVGGYDSTPVTTPSGSSTVGLQVIANAQHANQRGVYPGPGIPASALVPGARWGTATWTDQAGNLWLFGGNGNNDSSTGLLNDLWEFNASAYLNQNPPILTTYPGQWTFVSAGGSRLINQQGIYSGGTKVPGARVNSVTWVDNAGNFWLFGGYGFDGSGNEGYLNDLWEYTGGSWAWVSGSNLTNQMGVYGTAGTAAAANIPGGRHEAVGWADANGNLWLFGGEGEDSIGTTNGILNDLWMYSISNNQWTYVMGAVQVSSNQIGIANQTGVYGLQPSVGPPNTTGAASTCGLAVGLLDMNNNIICPPISAAGTFPGSRWGASGWTDAGGNFWLLGGWGLDATATNGNGALNDMWVYTPNSTAGQPGTWTWVKGSNTGSDNGNYGSLLRPYDTYVGFMPGGRNNATHWVDGYGQLWLFGGEGYDSTSTTGNGYLNDMWRYLPYQDY
jgi:hypothetical protein